MWVSRDPSTLAFVVSLTPQSCVQLATSCSAPDCFSLLPSSYRGWPLQISLSSTGLQITNQPTVQIVPLGSPSLENGTFSSQSSVLVSGSGLLHGGLTTNLYSWILLAGDAFQQPFSHGGDNVTLLPIDPTSGFTSVQPTQDFGNGTYGGIYNISLPGRYNFTVNVTSSSNPNDGIANSPFSLVFFEPTPCLGASNTTIPTFATFSLPVMCAEWDNNGCCDASLVATLNAHWAYLAATFGPYPPSECTRQLEILACGMACSPRNLDFLNRTVAGNNCTNVTTTLPPGSCNGTQTVTVCTTFCDDIWAACQNVVPLGSSSTVAVLYGGDSQAFCAAQFPQVYLGNPIEAIFNSTTAQPCYFGLLREPTCANTSYVKDRVPLVAGIPGTFTIVAQDCFGNPRISGGDNFVISVPPGVVTSVQDWGNGTYTVSVTAFTACLDACVVVSVSLNGQLIQNVPFGLNVVPNCASPLTTVYPHNLSAQTLGSQFLITVYDEWLNLAYNTREVDIIATAEDVATGVVVQLPVASLGCNGTFAVQTSGVSPFNCSRICVELVCRGTRSNLFCANPCNVTSYIFFSDTGTRIDMVLTENITSVPPILTGEFDCCLIVKNCELLGAGAYCVIKNQTDIQVFLPYNATVCSSLSTSCPPSLSNLYLDCSLLNVTGGACSNPLVTQILSPNPQPVVRLVAPEAFTRCAGVTIDGSASTNAGGRPALWTWQLVGPFAANDNHVAINVYLASFHGDPLVIDPAAATELFVEGVTYNLKATLTNHLDQTGSAVVTFTVLPDALRLPTLFISPTSPLKPASRQPLGFHAFLTQQGCLSPTGSIQEVLAPVAWVMPLSTPQPLYSFLANRTVNQNSLELPPSSMTVLNSPSLFQAWALLQQPISDVMRVTIVPRAPYVYVAEGNKRLFILGHENLVLNASVVFDWNTVQDVLTYQWSCVELVNGGPCMTPEEQALYMLPARQIKIPPYVLSLGYYVFRVTVSSPAGVSTVLDTQILTNGTAPEVFIDWVNADVIGGTSPSDVMSFVAMVVRDVRFGVMQTSFVTSVNLPALHTQPGLPDAGAVLLGGIGGDAQYYVRAVAADSEGLGYAEYAWVSNDRPNGGFCTITAPPSGSNTYFLRCSNWEDLNNDPLSYVTNILIPGFDLPLPLSAGRWFAPYMFFEAPPSTSPMTVQVTVVDQTDHGRSPYLVSQDVLYLGSSAGAVCPEAAASSLATATIANQVSLDTSRLVQRVVAICTYLRSGPVCDTGVQNYVVTSFLSILKCITRFEMNRVRAVLYANTLNYCMNDGATPLDGPQFESAMSMLHIFAATAGPSYRQEGIRSQPVAQSVLGALDGVLAAVAPLFSSQPPNASVSENVLSVLTNLSQSLRYDLRPGEDPIVAASNNLALQTSWWLPVAGAQYGYAPEATLVPSSILLENITDAPSLFNRPYLRSQTLRYSSSIVSNYFILPGAHPLPLPVSWTHQWEAYNTPTVPVNLTDVRDANYTFAVSGGGPFSCVFFNLTTGLWNESLCGDPLMINSTHVVCICKATPLYSTFAVVPLALLPDGNVSGPFTPFPPNTAVIPVDPALPAGLAIGALIVLAGIALIGYMYRSRLMPEQFVFVSTGVPESRIVPADNRIAPPEPVTATPAVVPMAVAVGSTPVVTAIRPEQVSGIPPARLEESSFATTRRISPETIAAVTAPRATLEEQRDIWTSESDDDNDDDQQDGSDSLLLSKDLYPSMEEPTFYDTKRDLW